MKRILSLVVALVLTAGVTTAQTAQRAPRLSYQVVVRDQSNNLVVNQPVEVSATLEQGGEAVYAERLSGATNTNGMLSLTLGGGEEPSEGLSGIDWGKRTLLSMEIVWQGGAMSYTDEVMAVPYAQSALFALSTDGIVDYIGRSGGEDVAAVYTALRSNRPLFRAMRDTIVRYAMNNYQIAKRIAFHYMTRVSASDVDEAYAKYQELTDDDVKAALNGIIKDYLERHRDMAYELAKYYLGSTNAAEIQRLYVKLLGNTEADAYVREVLYGYLDSYLKSHGLDTECLTRNGFPDMCALAEAAENMAFDPSDTCAKVYSVSSVGDRDLLALYNNRGVVMTAYTADFSEAKVSEWGFYYSTDRALVESRDASVKHRVETHTATSGRFGEYSLLMGQTGLCGETIYYAAYMECGEHGDCHAGTVYSDVASYRVPDYTVSIVEKEDHYELLFSPSAAKTAFDKIYDEGRTDLGGIRWYAGSTYLGEGRTLPKTAGVPTKVVTNMKECEIESED